MTFVFQLRGSSTTHLTPFNQHLAWYFHDFNYFPATLSEK